MKKFSWLLVFVLSVVLIGSLYRNAQLINFSNVYTDTVIVRDTIRDTIPVPVDSIVVRYKYLTIPSQPDTVAGNDIAIVDTASDSTTIIIPITQTKYEGQDYTAWVSGYDARLDSFYVYPQRQIITTTKVQKTGRWGLGVQLGVGASNKGFAPYIGIGISYNILTW